MISVKPTVYSVSQLNAYVKNILDNDDNLKQLFVTGEISNFKAHYSGHLYMTIKDESAAIKAVMFAGNASRLKFMPENGMKVIIFGTVSLFNRDGSYQLYITDMQPDGVGSLNVAFEQLKRKLEAEGLFSETHKKPIPRFPERVGVVTSETGAAVQDIFNVLGRRYPVAKVVLRPTKVQGEGAAEDIANAIKEFNELNAADVLIVGRGGGSVEDLWAFNEEIVARAVYASKIPVISAVGHETDFTICDFVADLRAPTPSAAAECAVPDAGELKAWLISCKQHIFTVIKNKIDIQKNILNSIEKSGALKDPLIKINDNRRELVYLSEKLSNAAETIVTNKKATISAISGKMDAMSPLKVLSRGYSFAVDSNNRIITEPGDVEIGESITLELLNGSIEATVTDINEVRKYGTKL